MAAFCVATALDRTKHHKQQQSAAWVSGAHFSILEVTGLLLGNSSDQPAYAITGLQKGRAIARKQEGQNKRDKLRAEGNVDEADRLETKAAKEARKRSRDEIASGLPKNHCCTPYLRARFPYPNSVVT
jgi:hypothetical protein